MKRTRADARTAWPSKHRRDIRAPAIATLRRVVCEQIKTTTDKVDELKLSDGPHPHQGRAARRANDCRFRNRRVDHAFFSQLVDDAFGDFEGAAIDADVFADQKARRGALHLFPDSSANRFDHPGHAATRRAFELLFSLCSYSHQIL